ncbi:MAG TPA: hypothetical protein PKD51_01765 [Saprospiraceae bacterium]|nr:hypothetical protein [Saprospiraceae bacterium]HMU02347.1 hypothetical protein [Saprospiraceae bacterium]
MKNLIQSTLFMFVTCALFSCAKENNESANSTENKILETRSSINWCDGGETNPQAVFIVPNTLTNENGRCCVTFRFLPQYNNLMVCLTTTDYNFNTNLGNSGINSLQYSTISNNLVTFCFPNQGSHILIQIYDGNGNVIACNTLAHPCV